MKDNRSLFELTADMAALEDELYETGGELTPEMELALPQTSEALVTKVDNIGILIRKFDSSVDVIDAEMKRLTALKKTCVRASENLKGYVQHSMEENGHKKLEGNLTKFSLRKSDRTITDDDTILNPYRFALEEYRKTLPAFIILPDIKVSKSAIKDLIKNQGIEIPGAYIEEHQSLIMK